MPGMLGRMDILNVYRETGAYLEGHFLLASGRHSPRFLQSTTVLQHPTYTDAIGQAIGERFAGTQADFVIGPAMGGVVLAYTVARALDSRALFAEKDGKGGMRIRNAFKIKPGETFVAIEDVITTGGSLKKAIAAAEAAGGVCVGIGCIIDRGLAQFPEGLELHSLLKLEFPTYAPDECPLCDRGVPLEEV